MGEQKRNRRQVLVTLLLIGMLLAASWPAAVQGQGPDEELARFLEARLREPESVPQLPGNRTEGVSLESIPLWHIETVDGGNDRGINVGEFSSLVLDHLDRPHISYYDQFNYSLKYAYRDGNTWHIDTVAWSGGKYSSLALDEMGYPHISCSDTWSGLKYVYFDGSIWHVEVIDPSGVMMYTSLALDSSGRPHISYYNSFDYNLKYAHFDGSAWQVEAIETLEPNGGYTSLALDSFGRPHISYYNGHILRYAHFDGTSWQIETVDSTGYTGLYTSLELDRDNYPHISYYDITNGNLKYAHADGVSWHIETIDSAGDVGAYTSLVLDETGQPHISYYDGTNGDLKYAYSDGSVWHIETVASGRDVGQHTSLALDSLGQPHISYYGQIALVGQGALWYTYFDGSNWHVEPVDNTKQAGAYNSLKVDTWNRPHISYYDQGLGVLKYGFSDGTSWHIETVDNTENAGLYTSLALDDQGRPHISYCIHSSWKCQALKYAYFDGSTWHIETVESGGVGSFTSLALDSSGRPHISYYDEANGDLKHAFYDGSVWYIETVDSNEDVGQYSSLAIDGMDHPHISYCRYDPSAWSCTSLKYARFDGISWHIETVDSGDWGTGDFASLALDASGRPHIGYQDQHRLKYAYYDGSSWHTEIVDEYLGSGLSLVLDEANRPHIAYDTGSRLQYAYFDGMNWHFGNVKVGEVSFPCLIIDSSGRPHLSYHTSYNYSLWYAYSPSSLADWSRLTFASYRDRNWEIYAARGDGAYPARLTANNKIDSRPEFNRGATQIAFYSDRAGNYEIYKMNADGSGQTRLTWTSFPEYQPSWSPDGSRIVYYGYPDTQTNAEIYIMNADGSGQMRLTWDPAWDGHPTWSPDGSRILFASNRSGGYELWTMAPDGTDLRQLTFGINYAAYPDWSPDGSRIAFNDDYNNDGWFDLAVINADGTGLTHPLGETPYYYDRLAPVWAPHGNDLAFAQIHYVYYQGNWYWTDAYIYGLDLAANTTYLLVDSGYDWWPDWQPTDTWPPISQMSPLPPWSGTAFPVSWSGSDSGGAGLRSYDVQYRDGAAGPWTDWLLDTPQTSAAFTGEDGHTYYFRCRARDYAFNTEPYPEDYEIFTTVDATPPTSAASSPEYASAPTFLVSWSGNDATSGIASYDIQVRDGAGGTWTDWLVETTETSAFFAGELGHTYYFRSRARDRVGNVETYPGGDGDTHTHTPQYALGGYIRNIREEPVALARVEAEPPALDSALSRNDGAFVLYFNLTGTYALSVTRSGFGTLPPMQGVPVPAVETPFFYLPPLDEVIADGGFEAGDLSAWNPAGEIRPTLSMPGHTGDYAALLGGSLPPPVVTPTEALSTSAVFTASGGMLTLPLAALEVPAGAISGTAVFTLSGVPTVTGLPQQDVGLHLFWAAALTDGTPITATLLPLTLTVHYSDAAWQAAQVAGEETLHLWRYDPVSATWAMLTTTLNPVSNTAVVTTALPGLYALAGAPYAGPWASRLVQEVELPAGGTLSLLYRVVGAEVPTDTLRVVLAGPTQTLTYTLDLAEGGWVHRFWDLPAGLGPTATLSLEWLQGGRERRGVLLDEVSLGTAAVGGYSIYLPLVLR